MTIGMSNMPVLDANSIKQAWPFYVVCDVSESMWLPSWHSGTTPWEIVSDSIAPMLDTLDSHNEAALIGHISIIAFAHEAWTHYPLRSIGDPATCEALPQGSWTNFVGAWEHLNATVRADMDRLTRQNYHLKQPVIFFITDGNAGAKNISQPITTWRPIKDALCDGMYRLRPRVVSLGMGDVNQATVLALRSDDPPGAACLAKAGVPANVLLKSIIDVIIKSISLSTDGGNFVFTVPEGMQRLDSVRP
ncbi:VWA domain-containing protein [Nocardia asteroides NBRC 15531]|uniref:VWFA domain-containing protein n=1 Tax=Nocardia asteroides NBRC 15531 TaxID=1110697 RepID=U5EFT5_NOCAS|nr:vWA domain-containing protein [Nocardia asteroides]TLF66847.1 VWA domain-containing protein [Nocardia asteroides NBRC 15531]UGT51907.1 VWA domain-containing protein [Nocardia asteroides]SFN02700.1 hypothetical protein SAMN05444423_105407 [Nocardia asteroides]VEG35179.1 Uncharacterized protein encoded in toxicity protection region of plasmid R478, contains von Willebrand factor (vWF) domain [Nocardia asteroides]GAD85273.1 hypothetical protein NCAST_30_00430 [Nocardia asteroides NBRC 15531]